MKYNTATEKLRAVNEGKMAKGEFVRQMRLSFPNSITQFNGFKDTVQILKNKGLVFEDYKKENNNLYMIFKTYNNIYPRIEPDYYSNYLIKKYFN